MRPSPPCRSRSCDGTPITRPRAAARRRPGIVTSRVTRDRHARAFEVHRQNCAQGRPGRLRRLRGGGATGGRHGRPPRSERRSGAGWTRSGAGCTRPSQPLGEIVAALREQLNASDLSLDFSAAARVRRRRHGRGRDAAGARRPSAPCPCRPTQRPSSPASRDPPRSFGRSDRSASSGSGSPSETSPPWLSGAARELARSASRPRLRWTASNRSTRRVRRRASRPSERRRATVAARWSSTCSARRPQTTGGGSPSRSGP